MRGVTVNKEEIEEVRRLLDLIEDTVNTTYDYMMYIISQYRKWLDEEVDVNENKGKCKKND